MKKLILLGFVGLTAGSLSAQFTITSTQFPVQGDTVAWQVASASLSGIVDNTNTGATGDGVVWDFTTLVASPGTENTDGTMTQRYIDPSTVSGTVSQNLANVAVQVDDNYSFHVIDNNGFQLTGVNSTVNVDGTDYQLEGQFSIDTDQMITFPFAYGDTYDDLHQGTGKAGGSADVYSDGSRTTTADGRGTLKLPGWDYSDVIRVKSVAERLDSIVFFGSHLANYTSNTETYSWYHEDYIRPILSISFNSTSSGDESIDVNYMNRDCAGVLLGEAAVDACDVCSGGTTGITPVNDENACANSVNDQYIGDQVSVYPNPVSASRMFQISNLPMGADLAIIDVTGKTLWTGKSIATSITALPFGMESGIYFLQITSQAGIGVKRFAVK